MQMNTMRPVMRKEPAAAENDAIAIKISGIYDIIVAFHCNLNCSCNV